MKKFIILLFYSVVLLTSEYLYRHLFQIPQIPINRLLENLGFIFILLSIFYFAKYRLTKCIIFIFFAISVIGNNIHYEIYKSWLTGLNYYLAFKEFDEVAIASGSLISKLIPHILWGAVDCLIFLSIAFFKNKRVHYAVDILFILLLVFTSVKGIKAHQEAVVSPKTQYGRIKEHFLSFGHFIGKVIPHEVFNLSHVENYHHSKPNKISQPKVKNIIFIVGESETASHVSAFGYERKTTPFFDKFTTYGNQSINQSDYSNTVLKETYSAGVLTLLSLPPLFNAIPYPNGHNQMNSGDTNFFRLSKEQGYNTYFYSSQPEDQMGMLNLLGKRWIDDVLFPTNLGFKQSESMPDEKLLPLFYKIDLNKGQNVVILHQRASHMPYGELLSEQDFVFGKEKLLDRYDSTIHKNDQFIEQVFTYLNQRKQNDWILIYTSDHGQYVTDKITNQGTTQLDNYLVPLFIYTPIDSLSNQTKEIFSYCQRANHYQLGTYLISLLGYDLSIGDCQKTYVNSNTLSGDLGYLEILQPSGETRYINPNEN